jgi:hypothetical protein
MEARRATWSVLWKFGGGAGGHSPSSGMASRVFGEALCDRKECCEGVSISGPGPRSSLRLRHLIQLMGHSATKGCSGIFRLIAIAEKNNIRWRCPLRKPVVALSERGA